MVRKFKAPFIFLHNPKTGGNSVQAFMNEHRYFVEGYKGHRNLRWYQDQFGLDIYERIPVYSVIRNPLDRLVSAYHFGMEIRDRPGMHDRRYAAICSEYFDRQYDFAGFVRKMYDQGMEDMYYWPAMLRPQKFMVQAYDGSVPVNLWPFEQLPNFIRHLAGKYTRSNVATIPHRNASTHRHFLDYYTPSLVEMVYALYPEDCRIYEQLIRPAGIQQATCRENAELQE